ncbi:YrbL family protein [Aestuariibius insulae]|uniref:YrbL family protein n=1 Tax=Aestuariibius insulae TaxID=2058287 RepID=UPI00398EC7F5
MPLPIPADRLEAVARGSERVVYRLAERPGVLLKIAKGRPQTPPPVYRYEQALWDARRHLQDVPLPQIFGTVPTELGLAQVVEEIADGEGRSRTLASLATDGPLTDATLERLTEFARRAIEMGIPIHDPRARNLLYGVRDGEAAFVIVDGFGDRALVPLKRWLPWLNARVLNRRFDQVGREVGLIWDAAGRRFARGE